MNIPIRGLNHITFSVANLDKSLTFYQKVFDAKLLLRGERMAYLDFYGLWLALNVQEDLPRQEIRQSYTHLAFTIDAHDLAPMEQRLNCLGVEIKPGRDRDEGEGQSLYFTDPDGHLLEFHTGNLAARLQAYREAGEEMIFYDHF